MGTWIYHATGRTAGAVAAVFAAEAFGEPREVEQCVGGWDGPTYRGRFRLVDGLRWYRIVGRRDGSWTVEVEAEGE